MHASNLMILLQASEQQLSVPVNKDGTLPNQNKEAVKTLDDDSQSELETTPQHIKVI